jgi:hypothetical protein
MNTIHELGFKGFVAQEFIPAKHQYYFVKKAIAIYDI